MFDKIQKLTLNKCWSVLLFFFSYRKRISTNIASSQITVLSPHVSSNLMMERIDMNHTWVTDDANIDKSVDLFLVIWKSRYCNALSKTKLFFVHAPQRGTVMLGNLSLPQLYRWTNEYKFIFAQVPYIVEMYMCKNITWYEHHDHAIDTACIKF